MFDVLWGLKTDAILDVWSFEHFIAGASVGAWIIKKNKFCFGSLYDFVRGHLPKEAKHRVNIFRYKYEAAVVLLIAYLWESVEFYGETGYWGEAAQYWFYGVEFWPNRVLFDPLLVVAGYFLSLKVPQIVWPARIFSVLWLYVHIFHFPHSMYLHTMWH